MPKRKSSGRPSRAKPTKKQRTEEAPELTMDEPAPEPPRGIMNKLPVELLYLICSLMGSAELCTFRLLCKDADNIAVQYLLRNVHVMFTAKSFQNLINISLHPVLRDYVQAVHFEALYLSDLEQADWVTAVRYARSYEDPRSQSASRRNDMEAMLENGWKAYKLMLDEQERLQRLSYEVSTFSQAFPRFSNLKMVRILGGARGERSQRSPQYKRAFLETMAVESYLVKGDLGDEDETAVRATRSLFLGIQARTGQSLRNLEIHRLGWTFFEDTPDSVNFYLPVFENLQSLRLAMDENVDEMEEKDEYRRRHQNLGVALRKATGLRNLELELGDAYAYVEVVEFGREMFVPVRWETIAGDMTWKNLETLKISGVTCSQGTLTAFFARHFRNLKSIGMANMWLDEGTLQWRKVFESMTHNLNLSELFIRGMWGGDRKPEMPDLLDFTGLRAVWVEDFILSKGSFSVTDPSPPEATGKRKRGAKRKPIMIDILDLRMYGFKMPHIN